jgi:hypothetical protein
MLRIKKTVSEETYQKMLAYQRNYYKNMPEDKKNDYRERKRIALRHARSRKLV